jgi:HD-like signal output (HDOD) protein
MSSSSVAPVLTRERILTVARGLPAAPQVLSELGELLQDPNTDLEQVSDLLRRDPALAARVIRIGNSPAFGGNALATVEEAVNRVGFGEIFRLVGLATTSRLADRALACYGLEAEAFRASTLFHALAAEALAREAAGHDPRVAYTAGLMRGVGMIVLDRLMRDSAAGARYAAEGGEGYAVWEGRAVALSNPEVAAVILAEWRFPADVVEGVRDHYLLGTNTAPSPLAGLLNAAGVIASSNGRALPGEASYWTYCAGQLAGVGVDDAAFARAAEVAEAAFERLKDTL